MSKAEREQEERHGILIAYEGFSGLHQVNE